MARGHGGRRGGSARPALRTGTAQDAVLEDVSHGSGLADFRLRWFRGERNVTQEAQGGGFGFELRRNRPKVFRLLVKPIVEDPGALCVAPRFNLEPLALRPPAPST
jgi:hypothetical protein